MAKGAYPDQLCMIGRVGHFEDAVNGVYVRVRGEAKKDEVRRALGRLYCDFSFIFESRFAVCVQ